MTVPQTIRYIEIYLLDPWVVLVKHAVHLRRKFKDEKGWTAYDGGAHQWSTALGALAHH
jgi:hypothetical protein